MTPVPDEQIISDLRTLADELGRSPASREWEQAGRRPTWRSVARRFGTWAAALEAAGLAPTEPGWPHRVVWTREKLIELLRADGPSTPTMKSWDAKRRKAGKAERPWSRVVARRFGSWNAGLNEAGYEVARLADSHGTESRARRRGCKCDHCLRAAAEARARRRAADPLHSEKVRLEKRRQRANVRPAA